MIFLVLACNKEGEKTALSYNDLWKIIIDKNMQKSDLISAIGISSSTIAKMGKGEPISLRVIGRICEYFECNIGDVVSFIPENIKGK
jgi:DNA-binding Xre family transcriptional regulator